MLAQTQSNRLGPACQLIDSGDPPNHRPTKRTGHRYPLYYQSDSLVLRETNCTDIKLLFSEGYRQFSRENSFVARPPESEIGTLAGDSRAGISSAIALWGSKNGSKRTRNVSDNRMDEGLRYRNPKPSLKASGRSTLEPPFWCLIASRGVWAGPPPILPDEAGSQGHECTKAVAV
jgi:hypothetical protein